MEEYRESYLILFRAVRDAILELEAQNYGKAKELLIRGEQAAEEAYLRPEESAKTT